MIKGKERHRVDLSFRKTVNALLRNVESDRQRRIESVSDLIEEYRDEVDDNPPPDTLEKLADLILDDELRDPAVDKVARTEYPVLSATQMRVRRERHDLVPWDEKTAEEYTLHDTTLAIYPLSRKTTKMTIKQMINTETEYYREINRNQPVTTYTMSTEEHLAFLDGLTNDELTKRTWERSDDDRVWADLVKERDGYICQNPSCSKRVGIMHAHHIESYADNEHLRTVLDNGVTLCSDCHSQFHGAYGWGGNNREQFNEWLTKNEELCLATP